MRLKVRNTMVLKLFRFSSKVICEKKTVNPQIAIFFFDQTWRGQDMT